MAGFDNEVMYASNVDFSGNSNVSGQITSNGQLLVGASSSPYIRPATLTPPPEGIAITNGEGSITFSLINDLLALENLASTGIAVRTASDTWAQRTITAGNGLAVTNGNGVSGNIVLDSNSGSVSWTVVTGVSQTLFTGNGYIANNNSTLIDFNLGGLSTGNYWKVVGKGSALFRVNCNGGSKVIYFGNQTSTVSTGYIQATNRYDCLELVATSSTEVHVISSIGNFTVV